MRPDLESRSEAEGDGTIDETINDTTTTISTTDAANTQQVIVYERCPANAITACNLAQQTTSNYNTFDFTTTSTSTNHSNNSCQQQQKR